MSSVNIDNFGKGYLDTLSAIKKTLSSNLLFPSFSKNNDIDDMFCNICYECLEPIYNKEHEVKINSKTKLSTKTVFIHKHHL